MSIPIAFSHLKIMGALSKDKSRHGCDSLSLHDAALWNVLLWFLIHLVCVFTLNIQTFHDLYDGSVTRCNVNNSFWFVCVSFIELTMTLVPSRTKKKTKKEIMALCVFRRLSLYFRFVMKTNFHFRTKTNSRWFILDVYRHTAHSLKTQ